MDEADYIAEVRGGMISPEQALRQLGDEFRTATMSLNRISAVYDALGDYRPGAEIDVALRIVQEHYSIGADGEFRARSTLHTTLEDEEDEELAAIAPPGHDQSAWDKGYGIPGVPEGKKPTWEQIKQAARADEACKKVGGIVISVKSKREK